MCLQRMDFLSLALIKKEWKERLWLAFIIIKVKEKTWVHQGTSLVASWGAHGPGRLRARISDSSRLFGSGS